VFQGSREIEWKTYKGNDCTRRWGSSLPHQEKGAQAPEGGESRDVERGELTQIFARVRGKGTIGCAVVGRATRGLLGHKQVGRGTGREQSWGEEGQVLELHISAVMGPPDGLGRCIE